MKPVKDKMIIGAWLLAGVAICYVGNADAAVHTTPPVGITTLATRAQLCKPGYSSSIRPPTSYTQRLKRQWVPAGHSTTDYELDHYIPISLGGSPTSPSNLWLQLWPDAKRKDIVEYNLYRDMCRGIYTPEQAQIAMREWR